MLEEGRAELEVLGIRQDRSVFWKQVVMVKAHDKQRIWMGHYCFMKDITERKQAEECVATTRNARRSSHADCSRSRRPSVVTWLASFMTRSASY